MIHWKNKKTNRLVLTCGVIGILMILIGGCSVSAHSPSSMQISYSTVTDELTVDISHQVADPNTHYVNNIEVTLNGQTELNKDYSSQPGSSFSYTYTDINASVGDTIRITAICNLGGSITEELEVGKSDGSNGGSSTPGFEVILFAIAIIFLVIFRKTR